MQLTNHLEATREQFKALVNYPKGEPVVMINILKFKEKSDVVGETGLQTYQRYSQNVSVLLKKVGAKVLWTGQVNLTVIGDGINQPNLMLLVEYPSVDKFIEMATSPEYKAIAHDRVMALEYGGLMASSTVGKEFFK
jgi:uncharacterized protein (DUF1330 family)